MSAVDKGVHSILAPSDAERWARCAGALLLSKNMPDIEAEYNASGTCSHWMLEECLKTGSDPKRWLGEELTFGEFKFKVDEERCQRVRHVIESLAREPGQMWIEKLLNTTPIFGRPDQIGHADVIKFDQLGAVEINNELYQGVLSVHDFKDGYIQVNAKNNMQGLSYLGAALYEYDLMAPITALRFCIHQPKLHHYDEWTYTRAEIEAFVIAIAPAAQLAYDIYHGKVAFNPDIHLNAGEEQCFWCPVKGSCPAYARRIIQLFEAAGRKHEVDDEALSKIYMSIDEIEAACKVYRVEALRRAQMGRTITGYKLVKGRRGKRGWTDEKKAETGLSMLLPPEEMYEPRTLISPTQAEEKLKKDEYAAIHTTLVRQAEGQPTLVPESDPRPAIQLLTFKPVEST